jgi:aryl-alcohol dehydrogenase-like predicted oxidoreductase
MRFVTLPGTTLKPSAIALGTNRFGSELDRETAFALLDAFLALGGTFLDTAHIYADWIPAAPRSASEKTIGAWLQSRRCREQVVLATKGGHPVLTTPHISRLSLQDLQHDVEASLSYLQTDHIDLYWLHRDDPALPVGAILEALNVIQQTGKIRYFGCSNWRAPRIRAALDYATQHGLSTFIANQPQWSLAVPNRAALSDPERLVVVDAGTYALHRDTGLALVPWSAQGQGYFDKLDRLGAAGLAPSDQKKYHNPTNEALYHRVKALAQQHATSVNAIALSYLLSQPFPTLPVIGPRTVSQLRESLCALEVSLTTRELDWLQPANQAA